MARLDDLQMITDAERDRAAWTLRESYASGALTLDEFIERLEGVFAAQSHAELHGLVPLEDQLGGSMNLAVAARVSSSDLDVINRHLSSTENVYWVGHPDPRVRLSRDDALFIPLSALLATIFVSWTAFVFGTGAPALLGVAGVALTLVAIYLVVGRFVFASRRRRRTLYVVTSRRVMRIVRRRRRDAVKGLYLTAIPSTSVRSSGGSVLFGDAPPYESEARTLTTPDPIVTKP